ncbi:MAG: RNA polymerase sigma factor [Opitutaceae bacterium]|nr:RNA polymerase sigma factor [Opitutaceae bacterium]
MPPPDQANWFAESVHPHEQALRAFLSRRFASLPDHDDLVQETYARLLRVSDPQRLVHPRAFLFTIARNVAIDHVRRTRRTPVDPIDSADETALFDPTPGAAEVLDHAQRHQSMLTALATLPERCREVMLLRYVDGFSTQEIAAHLGLAAATVRVHLMKGVRDCAQFFRERGLLDATAPEQGRT